MTNYSSNFADDESQAVLARLQRADQIASQSVQKLQENGVTDPYTLYLYHKAAWSIHAGGEQVSLPVLS